MNITFYISFEKLCDLNFTGEYKCFEHMLKV